MRTRELIGVLTEQIGQEAALLAMGVSKALDKAIQGSPLSELLAQHLYPAYALLYVISRQNALREATYGESDVQAMAVSVVEQMDKIVDTIKAIPVTPPSPPFDGFPFEQMIRDIVARGPIDVEEGPFDDSFMPPADDEEPTVQ